LVSAVHRSLIPCQLDRYVPHVISGRRDVGAVLVSHPDIAKIMFTGSTAAGQDIIRSSADTVKRLTLELGGNDAGIVLPDANPKEIAENLFWGAFINTGQTCAALKRLYVHEDIYDAVCEELTKVAASLGSHPAGPGRVQHSEIIVLCRTHNRRRSFGLLRRLTRHRPL
jgi:acyl-CoA reductase-like NAD-dependent aldehyde dehydrogenase